LRIALEEEDKFNDGFILDTIEKGGKPLMTSLFIYCQKLKSKSNSASAVTICCKEGKTASIIDLI
jgi:hypothetical protein